MAPPPASLRAGLSRALSSLREACQGAAEAAGARAAAAAEAGGGGSGGAALTRAARTPRPPRAAPPSPPAASPWPAPPQHHWHWHDRPLARLALSAAAGAASVPWTSPFSTARGTPAGASPPADPPPQDPGFVRGGFRLEDFPPERVRNFSIVVRAAAAAGRGRGRTEVYAAGPGGRRAQCSLQQWRRTALRQEMQAALVAPLSVPLINLLSRRLTPFPPRQAHIDHGKSTLSDRLMQRTGAVAAGARAQYLDRLQVGGNGCKGGFGVDGPVRFGAGRERTLQVEQARQPRSNGRDAGQTRPSVARSQVERERGITVKAQSVSLVYRWPGRGRGCP
jgi:hypothetical protein